MAAGLEGQYAVARRVAFQVEEQLQQLETGRDTSVAFQANISTNLNQLAAELSRLDALVAAEPAADRRAVWRRKLKHLTDSSQGLRDALDKFVSRNYRLRREAEERAELFQRRNAGGQVSIELEQAAHEMRALHEASASLDSLTGRGAAVLASLAQQSAVLRASRRKLGGMFDALGLSNSLLRMIERRQLVDRALVFGGMLLLSLLLWLVVRGGRG